MRPGPARLEPLLLTLTEAAAYLNISYRSLRSAGWRKRYGVPTVRVGRRVLFSPDQLRAWLATQEER